MLKLHITQPGHQDMHVEVDGDEAVLGRTGGCDVVLPQPFVSKRHVKVLAGLVVVDLGSSNGTFVQGALVKEPTLLTGSVFRLGNDEKQDVQVVVHHEPSDDQPSTRLIQAREDLDQERRRAAQLVEDVSALRNAAKDAVTDPEALPIVRDLTRERDDLRSRVESLKREVESRDVEASAGLQARLAGDAMAEVQRRNEELQRRVEELESHVAAPEMAAAKRALTMRVAELEGDRGELEESVRRLRNELADSRSAAEERAAMPASDLFIKLQAENRSLREELENARGAPKGGDSELFFDLKAENVGLAKRVEELESALEAAPVAPAPGAAQDERVAALQKENHELRMSKADLLSELDALRSKVQEASATPPAVPACAPPQPGSSPAGELLELLGSLATGDAEAPAPLVDGAVDSFLVLELFRFTRQVERVVTRMAAGFIQLYQQQTLLPDIEGNLRGSIAAVLAAPSDSQTRGDLVSYLDELRKWMVVSLGSHRRAAERFAEQVKSDLSVRSLTESDPVPVYMKIAGQGDAELWRRTEKYMKKLTADVIDDRIEDLCRTCAAEMMREQETPARGL